MKRVLMVLYNGDCVTPMYWFVEEGYEEIRDGMIKLIDGEIAKLFRGDETNFEIGFEVEDE